MNGYTRVDILGCPFDAISFDETVACMHDAVVNGRRLQVVPGSVDFVMKCRRDSQFADDLRHADLVVADGVPIVWSASLLGTPIRHRVSGTELVWSCAEISQHTGTTVALIGGVPGVAQRAAAEMQRRFPRARLVDIATPWPLSHDGSLAIARAVRELKAGIVLVALGAPRQERWVRTYLAECGASVGVGIGSAFDIISGDRPRAPRYMQRAGLEWFHRMLLEPRRLGRRYLIEDSPYVLLLLRALMSRRGPASVGRSR
jgi:N-acetylglucosaminyldiphosphoundecaprenol N-acetyl-beta-D-mannosaminyltransferase